MQFIITYRDAYGPKFAVIDGASKEEARLQIQKLSPSAAILTVRENNPPLPTITEVK